jgi:glutaredoxin-dependent peroxiredoxin
MLQIGDRAPLFSLVDSDKQTVSLKSYKGKNVVVLFFPFAYTGVCTAELCSMRDSIGLYKDLDAEILAISVDSPFTLAKFKADNNYNFPLLSDFNKKTIKKYDTMYKDFFLGLQGVAKRSAFVVDKKGIIRYAQVLESAGDLPDFDAVNAVLRSL